MIASHSIITTYHVTVGPQCPQWGVSRQAAFSAGLAIPSAPSCKPPLDCGEREAVDHGGAWPALRQLMPAGQEICVVPENCGTCLLYTSPSPRDS